MYDAIVVGARCAGAATAMLLARRGHRVLLVDRSQLPQRPCGCPPTWSGSPASRASRSGGCSTSSSASGCPADHQRARSTSAPFALDRPVPRRPATSREAYAPRRRVLDGLLRRGRDARPASSSWEGCTVDGLLTEDDAGPVRRVHGIRGRLRTGGPVTATARASSSAPTACARPSPGWCRPPSYLRAARRCRAPTSATGAACRSSEYDALRPALPDVVRQPDQRRPRPSSAVNWPLDEYRAARADIAGNVPRAPSRRSPPSWPSGCAPARREERWFGAAVPGLFRRPYGAGLGAGRRRRLRARTPAPRRESPTPSPHAELARRGRRRRRSAAAGGHRRGAGRLPAAARRGRAAHVRVHLRRRPSLEPPPPRAAGPARRPARRPELAPTASSGSSPARVPVHDFFGAPAVAATA